LRTRIVAVDLPCRSSQKYSRSSLATHPAAERGRLMPRIVCVSDTHAPHHMTEMPPGDILVHAGDITRDGALEDVEAFNDWLESLNYLYRHKVVICGNHDFCFQERAAEARARITSAVYLEDSGCEIEGLTFYGSPWQPWFGGWAFNLP